MTSTLNHVPFVKVFQESGGEWGKGNLFYLEAAIAGLAKETKRARGIDGMLPRECSMIADTRLPEPG